VTKYSIDIDSLVSKLILVRWVGSLFVRLVRAQFDSYDRVLFDKNVLGAGAVVSLVWLRLF
jgi:hypothetical protein